MTEQEWLTGTDPEPMLEFLGRRASERKLLLLGSAAYGRQFGAGGNAWLRAVLERYADGAAGKDEWARARATDLISAAVMERPRAIAYREVKRTFPLAGRRRPARGQGWDDEPRALRAAECALVRDLFGNPFRPPEPVRRSWLEWDGGTVARMARSVYEGRHFAGLPVLADALEEAGCDRPDLLGHCRSRTEHARGCWVVDLLLGKR